MTAGMRLTADGLARKVLDALREIDDDEIGLNHRIKQIRKERERLTRVLDALGPSASADAAEGKPARGEEPHEPLPLTRSVVADVTVRVDKIGTPEEIAEAREVAGQAASVLQAMADGSDQRASGIAARIGLEPQSVAVLLGKLASDKRIVRVSRGLYRRERL